MRVPDTKENLGRCLCKECPSYNGCMKDGMQGVFCSRGRVASAEGVRWQRSSTSTTSTSATSGHLTNGNLFTG
jgi:hypothetical protein